MDVDQAQIDFEPSPAQTADLFMSSFYVDAPGIASSEADEAVLEIEDNNMLPILGYNVRCPKQKAALLRSKSMSTASRRFLKLMVINYLPLIEHELSCACSVLRFNA